MLNLLRRLIAPKIIEVELTRPRLDPEARKSLTDLKGHPGLTYIVTRLRYQRWYLENHMRTHSFVDMRELDQVQSGMRWLAWIERQIEETINADIPQPRTPDAEDIESFVKVQTALELVGRN